MERTQKFRHLILSLRRKKNKVSEKIINVNSFKEFEVIVNHLHKHFKDEDLFVQVNEPVKSMTGKDKKTLVHLRLSQVLIQDISITDETYSADICNGNDFYLEIDRALV